MIEKVIDGITFIGAETIRIQKDLIGFLSFFGETCFEFVRLLIFQRKFRFISVCHHIYQVGFRAVFIVGLISYLIGMVLAYQGINQLSRFGAEIFTIDFLGISVLREISVLLTSIVIAGRSGSAFAAQIGMMVVNQEVNALKTMGIDPMSSLVLPRIIALITVLPLLVFFSMMMGLIGGMVMLYIVIDIHPFQFWLHFQKSVDITPFLVGLSKTPFFAFIIGLVGCYRGLCAKGSAQSVGMMTTKSVVESIFMIIVLDAFISIFYSYLGI